MAKRKLSDEQQKGLDLKLVAEAEEKGSALTKGEIEFVTEKYLEALDEADKAEAKKAEKKKARFDPMMPSEKPNTVK
jgi:hypothetical protein